MQPTTNTPFERFAFAAVIFLIFSCPFWAIGLILLDISLVCLIGGFSVPIFCIVCAIKIERDHIKALVKAERELSDIMVSDMKTLPQHWKPVKTTFVSGNVVLADDYFKAILWSFRKLFGGESKAFSKLLSRARREATLRVLRQAKACGANVVWNIRYETSVVQTNRGRNMAGVEVLAYATAFTTEAE